jgi:hypothetical protein
MVLHFTFVAYVFSGNEPPAVALFEKDLLLFNLKHNHRDSRGTLESWLAMRNLKVTDSCVQMLQLTVTSS